MNNIEKEKYLFKIARKVSEWYGFNKLNKEEEEQLADLIMLELMNIK